MAITKKKFQKIAKKMLSGVFKDFLEACPIYNIRGINYETQREEKEYQSPVVSFIRIDYEAKDVDGQLIQSKDFMLIAEYQALSIAVNVDTSTLVYKNENYQIKKVDIDPADATIILQVRRK